MKTAVVTGMGLVTPIGNSLDEFRKALKGGLSGKGPITRFDTDSFLVKQACEVKDFKPGWRTSLLDPFIQYGLAAAEQAVKDAQIVIRDIDSYRVGIVLGSSKGGLTTFEKTKKKYGDTLPSALHTAALYASFPPNIAAQWLAKRYRIHGPAKCFSTACSTGTYSIIEGARMIEEGEVDYCIAGASDASITELMLAGYYNMKAYSRKETMRPYDKDRDGFLVGEGAGVVLLESEESAKARGVDSYAKVISSSFGSDGVSLINYSKEAHGCSELLSKITDKANIKSSDIDYINTHGTSTVEGDEYEVSELKHWLNSKADTIPMSSTKSMTGHLLGASGAVEFIASCLAIKEGWIHPTIQLENVDKNFDLDFVPHKMREKQVNLALSFSLAFGGHMAGILIGKS